MKNGFTLIETLIGIAIFMIISVAIYSSYSNVLSGLILGKLRLTAITVLENEIETIRNIPYPDVGTQGGVPSGNLQSQKIVTYVGVPFTVKTTVRNIDDPFDGTLSGNPNDTIPSDYKLVEVEVSCASTCSILPVTMTTTVAPKDIEKLTKNGALFINVFDASGSPVSNANVSITNNLVNPIINLNDTTNASGSLNFVDIATSSGGFHIVVTKSGYSSDQTYPITQANPNPTIPDATVNEQELTKISFAIDQLSTVTFKTQNNMCVAMPNIDFKQTGTKLIGTNPDVLKYSVSSQTDVTGQKVVNNLEWDAYNFENLNPTYDITGSNPTMPLAVNPNSAANLTWTLGPAIPKSLLVTVFDEDLNLVNDVSVRLTGPGVDQIKLTSRSSFSQTDWSGVQYTSQAGNINADSPTGQLTLAKINGKYATVSQELISSTFDMGTSNTTFYTISWNPIPQPVQAGADSLKFQIATNNDNATWNFKGPNGNSNTYYTASDTQLHSSHNGNRYLRYKVFMKTDNDQYTPTLEDVTIIFHSSCTPDGQIIFNGLPAGTYDISVSKSGFDTTDDVGISVSNNWQSYEETLYVP